MIDPSIQTAAGSPPQRLGHVLAPTFKFSGSCVEAPWFTLDPMSLYGSPKKAIDSIIDSR